MKKTIRRLVALASLTVSMAAGAAPAGTIGPADIKGDWPLTVQPVHVLCDGPNRVMLEAPDGKVYGVNGKTHVWAREGVGNLNGVWRVVNPAKGSHSPNLVNVTNLATTRCAAQAK